MHVNIFICICVKIENRQVLSYYMYNISVQLLVGFWFSWQQLTVHSINPKRWINTLICNWLSSVPLCGLFYIFVREFFDFGKRVVGVTRMVIWVVISQRWTGQVVNNGVSTSRTGIIQSDRTLDYWITVLFTRFVPGDERRMLTEYPECRVNIRVVVEGLRVCCPINDVHTYVHAVQLIQYWALTVSDL